MALGHIIKQNMNEALKALTWKWNDNSGDSKTGKEDVA